MKKRVLSLLLCGLMAVSLLSASALALELPVPDVLEATGSAVEEAAAEAEETVTGSAAEESESLLSGNIDDSGHAVVYSYEELVVALADPNVQELDIVANKMIAEYEWIPFSWPEEEVTLELKPAYAYCNISLWEGNWVIPENVTVNAYRGITGNITVNGTWNIMNNYASFGGDGLTATVNGTLAIATGVSTSLYGSIYLNGTLENAGTCYLYGNLTLGPDAEVVDIPDPNIINSEREIRMWDGASITATGSEAVNIGGRLRYFSSGTLSGKLNVDSIWVSSGDALTIAEGADVTIAELRLDETQGLTVNGRLYLNGNGYNMINRTEVTLGENGVLRLAPYVQFGGSDSGSSITGTGTLELEGEMNERSDGVLYCWMAPQVFGQNSLRTMGYEVYEPLPYVADSVTVVRLWDPDGVEGDRDDGEDTGDTDGGDTDDGDTDDGDGGEDTGDEQDVALKVAYKDYIYNWLDINGTGIEEGLFVSILGCLQEDSFEELNFIFMECQYAGLTDSVPMTLEEFAEQYASDGDDSGDNGGTDISVSGNVNGDETVDTADLVLLMKNLVGVEGAEFAEDAGDVNGDGGIDILDVIALVRYLAGGTSK